MIRRIQAALLRLRLSVTTDPATRARIEVRLALLEGRL